MQTVKLILFPIG